MTWVCGSKSGGKLVVRKFLALDNHMHWQLLLMHKRHLLNVRKADRATKAGVSRPSNHWWLLGSKVKKGKVVLRSCILLNVVDIVPGMVLRYVSSLNLLILLWRCRLSNWFSEEWEFPVELVQAKLWRSMGWNKVLLMLRMVDLSRVDKLLLGNWRGCLGSSGYIGICLLGSHRIFDSG